MKGLFEAMSRLYRRPENIFGTAVLGFRFRGRKPGHLVRAGALLCLSWALACGLGLRPAFAASNSASVDLQVTFSGTLSVAVDGMNYSTRSFSAGANAFVVPSSATVTNTSNGLTETWQLSVSTVSGGANWSVLPSTQTAPDVDQFAYQALFISSATTIANQPAGWANGCPDLNASDWNNYNSVVTSSSTMYTSNIYSDPRLIGGALGIPDAPPLGGGPNDNMFPISVSGTGARGLCARVWMPAGMESQFIGVPQVIRLMITAAPGN